MAFNPTPSLEQLKRAVALQEKIAELQAQLSAVLGGQASATTGAKRGPKPKAAAAAESVSGEAEPKAKKKKKRTMSPEAREKIAAAQRKRWAKQKKAA